MRRFLQFFPFAALVVITWPIAVLPYRLAHRIGALLGFLIYLLWRSRRSIALDNMSSAAERGALSLTATPQNVVRQNFRNLGRFLVEVIKIYYGKADDIFCNVALEGVEHFERANRKGKGVILITGHCGNWELMAVYLSMHLTRVKVVARKQNNYYINRFIERTRQRYGNEVIYKEGALKKMLGALKRNQTIGILMDQSTIRSEGIIIPFLGRNAYAMKTPAIIARKTGSPVLPLFIRREGLRHIIEIGAEIPLAVSGDSERALIEDTVNFLRPVEEFIRHYPADWLWIHRKWKRVKDESDSLKAIRPQA